MRQLVICCLLIVMTGCQSDDNTADLFKTYQQRLANVTDSDTVALADSYKVPLPRKRELIQPIEDVRFGLLDAYDLRKCGLFELIAERNSVLGKIQDPFRLLDYEITFLRKANACMPLVEDVDIKKELQEAIDVKTRQLPTRYWNAIGGSDAWNKQLVLPATMLNVNEATPRTAVVSAISAFASVQSPNGLEVSVTPWQETIEKQKMLGSLFLSIDESRRWLTAINKQLEENDHRILCGENINQTKAKYLRNVFDEFYIKKIQPYLSSIDTMYLDVSPSLEKIALYADSPRQFDEYKTAYFTGLHYQLYKKSVKDHVFYWKSLFERCNIRLIR
ncbi:DUF3080 family protein [Veronia pacifica]|uniref:DUF3080 family protein n=1 Tax=Veronia pacifica TaxID=1080227 RepID=UPI000A7F7666